MSAASDFKAQMRALRERMHIDPAQIAPSRRVSNAFLGAAAACALLLAGYLFYYRAPAYFPAPAVISVSEGSTLVDIAEQFESHGIVRSGDMLRSLVIVMGGETSVQAGDYFFDRPISVYAVAQRILHADFGLTPFKVRIPEGATTYQIAALLDDKMSRFDSVTFLALAREKEGYLYPDTYFFLPNSTAQQVIDIMEQNFYERIEELAPQIEAFGRPLDEVVTMASLLEKEARYLDEKQVIAGILWKRLEIEMPLQVDAVFGYINGTTTFSPKFSDLEVDSPYNTYKYKGLPPGPIASPSLSSVEAAVTPVESDYLFYLTGRDGVMRYARNFEEHKTNRARYLD